jgi:hypothetical protein
MRVLPFCGKSDELPFWSETFLAKAKHKPSQCKAKSLTMFQNEATRVNNTSTGTAMASIINAYDDNQE